MSRAFILVAGNDANGRPTGRLVTPGESGGELVSLRSGAEEVDVLGDVAISRRSWTIPVREFHDWQLGVGRKPANLSTIQEPREMVATRPGDLLIAEHCEGRPAPAEGEPGIFALSGVRVLERDVTWNEELAARVAAEAAALGMGTNIFACFADVSDLDITAAEESARHQPNEALVLAWNDARGELQGRLMGSTGSWFFHADGDDLNNNGIRSVDGPGVFLFVDGKAWATGDGMWDEHDAGVDGDAVPLTEAAVTECAVRDAAFASRLGNTTDSVLENFGWDKDGFRSEVADVLEQDAAMPPGSDPFAWLAAQGAEIEPDWLPQIALSSSAP